MATITLVNPIFYKDGKSGVSAVTGYEGGSNRVVRYTMTSPATGASNVYFEFNDNARAYEADWVAYPSLRFYIGTDANSHSNAGASSTYTGVLSRTEATYTGSANIILLPNTTYYVWVFPATTTYGWLHWSKSVGDAVATTSGGALSTLSCSNGTLDTEQTLTVTRYSTELTHTITYECESASGTICTKSSNTSIPWTPPLSLASQNTTGTTVAITLTITTYNGSTNIGSNTKTITCAIPSTVKPSCSLAVSDPTGYADTYGGYIKGLSKFKIVVTAETSYDSAIASYSVTANGTKYTKASFTTDEVQTVGNQNIVATVTDKRKRSGSDTETVTVLDYSAPVITSLSVHRCNEDGTANDQGEYVKVVFSGKVTALNNKNTAKYTVEYKKTSDSGYTSVVLTAYNNNYSVTGVSYIFAADTGSSYDVRVTVADAFYNASKSTSASTGFTLMHWKADGTAMGIGKVAEKSYALDMGLDIELNDNDIYKNGIKAFAPHGFNLGELSGTPPNTDLNAAMVNGYYRITSAVANYPFTHGAGQTLNYNANEAVQTIYQTTSGNVMIRRTTDGGATWIEEWVNPPMILGVEYRTTKRYLGEVVYTKAVNFGAFPNTTNKNVAHASTVDQQIIYLQGQLSDGVAFSTGYNQDRTSGGKFWVDNTKWSIRILTESDMSSLTATVVVEYIKL